MTKLNNMLDIGRAKRPLSLQLPIAVFLVTISVVTALNYIHFNTSAGLILESNKQYLRDKNAQIKTVIETLYEEKLGQQALFNQFSVLQKIKTKLINEKNIDISSELNEFEKQAKHALQKNTYISSVKYISIPEQRELVSVIKNTERIEKKNNTELKKYHNISSIFPIAKLNKGNIVFSNILKKTIAHSQNNYGFNFQIIIPVNSEAINKLIGVIVVEVDFYKFMHVLFDIIIQDSYFVLADKKGMVLFDSHKNTPEIKIKINNREQALKKIMSEEKPLNLDLENANFVNISSPKRMNRLVPAIYQEFQYVFNNQIQEFKWLIYPKKNRAVEVLNKIQSQSMVFTIAMVTAAFLLLLFIVRRMLKPLNKIISVVSEIETKERLDELPIEASDESGVLARILYNMQVVKRFKDKQVNDYRFSLDQHAIVCAVDIEGKIIFANSKFAEISGKNKDELIGTEHKTYYSSNHNKDCFKHIYDELYAGNVWNGQMCFITKNVGFRWIDTTVVPQSNNNGSIYQFMFIGTDITKEKCALNALRESELRFEMSRAVSNDGIWDWDIIRDLHFFDEHYYSMAGYEVNEFKAESGEWERRVHPEDLNAVQFQLNEYLLGNTQQYKAEFRFRKKDNSYMWILAKGKVVEFDATQRPIRMIGTHQDITDVKESENKIINEKNKAEKAVQSKNEFFASMSHEIRTPMNGVLGMLGLMMRTELNKRQKHYATLARSSADSLLAIIDDILDLSKIEAGKIELEILDFNIREQLGIFAEAMAYRAQDKGLEIVLDVTGIEHSMVKGDPSRLRQVLSNLVGNAIKFTEAGEITIIAKLEKYNENEWILYCEVSDSGIGVPEDKINDLFDSYSQLDTSTTRKFGGTGLGLAIVKQLCLLMNGGIQVKSQLGVGSQFIFNVRLGMSEISKLVTPTQDVSGKKILLVDDNPTNLEVLVGQLEHWGVSTESASNGMQALDILKRKQSEKENYFDIAILDMGMPDMDGSQLGALIRADSNYDDLKLVMMTSMAGSGDINKFKNLGFSAYFPKPATTSDLFHALQVLAEDGEVLEQLDGMVTNYNISNITSTNQFSNARILLVEDNLINQEVAKGILEDMGITVDIADNGAIAIEKLVARQVDFGLVLMDCQMPVMDGYEATRYIRSQKDNTLNANIPIVAMTANALKGDRQKCIDAGMNDYLTKPIAPNALEEKLRSWLPGNQQDHHLLLSNARPGAVKQDSSVYITEHSESKVIEKELKPALGIIGDKTEKILEEEDVLMLEGKQKMIWDRASLLERIRNNEKLAGKLIRIFLTDLPRLSEELKASVNSNDLEMVAAHSHRIKGSSANLSAIAISEISAAIEKSARDENIKSVKDQMGEFEKQVKVLLEKLNKEIESQSM